MPIQKEELDVVLRAFDDARGLIAALKVQRWEDVKWSATLNVAIAAASAGFEKLPAIFFCFAVAIALLGIGLVHYHNDRLTRTRDRTRKIYDFLGKNVFNLNDRDRLDLGVGGEKGRDYDWQELWFYTLIIALSALPSFVVWVSV